jgi:maltose O-acetyltransferase
MATFTSDLPRRALARLRADPVDALQRTAALARAHVVFRGREQRGRIYVFGPVRVAGTGRIVVGAQVSFRGGMFASEVTCHAEAEVIIGERTVFNYGVSIEAHRSIRIGRDCMFGSLVRLGDAEGGTAAPITIGDHVWLAHGVIVAPGVTIGDGSVVSAGSVVTADVPPGSMAAGNPARAVSLTLFRSAG